jgi:leucyl/phenylalanyl-tRNA--protein transferase
MTRQYGTTPCWLEPDSPATAFPDVETALHEPDGLLAIGGDLSKPRLLEAYRRGIFPWYSDDQPRLWWSPDPRLVLAPAGIRVSRSLAKTLRREKFVLTMDRAFNEVIQACAEPRPDQSGTWITSDIMTAYKGLHADGYAHSVECWYRGELAGGLYGVSLGRVFFGESMFSRVTDASKVALVYLARQLVRWKFTLIDCQVHTGHLERLGAVPISRTAFTRILAQETTEAPPPLQTWRFDTDLDFLR